MFFSENIYFLILFTMPAALNILFNAHIRQTPVTKDDKSVELAECVAFCFAVFICNVIVMHDDAKLFVKYSLLNEEAIEVFCQETKFDYVRFMTKYFGLNIVNSICVLIAWYTLGQWCLRKIQNVINKITHRPIESKYPDVWRNIFETGEIVDINNCIIKIEKAGYVITAGLIRQYSAPNVSNKEFVLYNTDLIKQLFEDDCKKKLKKKMFPNALYEYYDIQNDILIKFYDTERYDKKYAKEE